MTKFKLLTIPLGCIAHLSCFTDEDGFFIPDAPADPALSVRVYRGKNVVDVSLAGDGVDIRTKQLGVAFIKGTATRWCGPDRLKIIVVKLRGPIISGEV